MSSVGVLAQLIEQDQVGRVTNAFTEMIAASMAVDNAPTTAHEIKRRFGICLRVFRELRGDLKWSIAKILDHLPYYLRCELDGGKYNPNDETRGRKSWVEQQDPLAHPVELLPEKREADARDVLLVDEGGAPMVLK